MHRQAAAAHLNSPLFVKLESIRSLGDTGNHLASLKREWASGAPFTERSLKWFVSSMHL